MQEKEFYRLYSYAFYSAAIAMFVASALTLNAYVLAFSIASLLVAAILFSSGHLINDLVLKRAGPIAQYCGFRLSRSLCSATRKAGGKYLSISAAVMKQAGDVVMKGELVESLISNIDFPFEFSLGIKSVDKGRVIDGLETKRRMKEIEISRADPQKYDRMNALKRELSVMEGELKSLREQKPLSVEAKLKTFGLSKSEIEASSESERNMGKLSGAFASMLGFECETLKGEALLEEASLQRVVV
jgi:hypothetical protein